MAPHSSSPACVTSRQFPLRCRLPASRLLTALLLAAGVWGCAQAPSDPEARAEFERNNDPAEPTNRAIFGANQFVDRNALRPVAVGYNAYVPGPVRRGLHNAVSNLGEPAIAVNDVLQGNLGRAWNTTQRFAINTTAGGAGLFDVATDWNRPHHDADLGQTLGVWGIGPGPSVQLPLFGPSNVRDGIGKLAGSLTNPISFIPGSTASTIATVGSGVGVVDGEAGMIDRTDALQKSSLDYYATLRSVAAQRRAKLVEEGRAGLIVPKPDSVAVSLPEVLP